MYKRFVAGVILLAGVIAAAGAQETIKMGYWDNAPFVIAQPGGAPPAGAAVDYWTAIVAPAMNVKVAWVGPTALPRLLIQLQSGEIDAVLVAARTPEREKLFQFAAAPSLHFLPGLAVLKENPLAAIKSADNIAGMKVGYATGLTVIDFMKNAKITWDNMTTATWIQDDFRKLMNKRIDAVFNLTTVGLQYEAAKSYSGKFKFLPLPVPPTDIYTMFARTDRATAFLKQYDSVNAKNASKVEALVNKYISQ